MPVLHLLGSAADGGAETYFTSLIPALRQAGVETAAAIRAHEGREAALKAVGVPTTVLPFARFDWRTRGRVRALARSTHAEVLLAWMNRAASHTPEGDWARIGRLGGYYDLKYYSGFDALVGNTAHIRDWMVRQGCPAEHAHYIPNFAEADAGAFPLDKIAFDMPDKAPLLLAMGRLHPSKAHDVTLRAMTKLPGVYLWIAGAGPLQAQLEGLARDLGVADRVRFLGWRDDASALYRTADAVVFPSRYEPLGNVVIQAWAHGLPVVAAESQGPKALIQDGKDGLLVPIDDADALAGGIGRLLAEPELRRSLAAAGARRVNTEFSEAAVVGQWKALFADFGVA
jgi:glycosyltransferase involved in cell wall biosynthesis